MLFRRPSRAPGHWQAVAHHGALAAAAQVSFAAGGRPRLDWLWRGDADSLSGALRGLQRQHAVRGGPLVGLAPQSDYRILSTEAPDVPREEWRDAIRWSLREQVDFAVDDALIDVLALPQATQIRQSNATLTVALGREGYNALELAADDQGLAWAAIEVQETALRNVCALGEEPDRAHALLAFGEHQAMLVITFQGELVMMRHIEVTLAAVTAEGETRGQALSRAALEVLRTLDTHERVHSQAPLSCLSVALPPGCDDGTLGLLTELIYLPVQALDLSACMDLAEGDDTGVSLALQPTAIELCVIGAALRGWCEAQGRQQVNLIDPHSAVTQPPSWGARFGLRLAAVALTLCGLAAGGLAWSVGDASRRADAAEARLAELQGQSQGLPEDPAVKLLANLKQQEAVQRQMRDVLRGSGAEASNGYSDYMMALGRQAQGSLWVTGLRLSGDGRDLELRGRTTDPAMLPPYLARLHGEERFKGRRFAQVELRAVAEETDTPQGVTEFILRGQLQTEREPSPRNSVEARP